MKTLSTILAALLMTACTSALAQTIDEDLAAVQLAYLRNADSTAWFKANVDKRADAWQKGADDGDPGAMWLVGWCHLNKYGDFDFDPKKTFELTKAAAEAGNVLAQNGLGYLYQKGDGVEENGELALQWYKKAADAGFPMACWNLAEMYSNGDGVDQDTEAGDKWHEKGAEMGQFASIRHLIGKHQYSFSPNFDPAKVEKYLNMLGEAGDPKGFATLVIRFEEGDDKVEKDPAKADKYRDKLEAQVGDLAEDYIRLVAATGGTRGRKMPRLEALRDGKVVRLGDAAGKVVAVRFGADWCRYCREQNPTFEEVGKQHADFVLLEVDVDENAALTSLWDVRSIPRIFLVDQEGALIETYGSSVKSLPEAVDKLLSKEQQ